MTDQEAIDKLYQDWSAAGRRRDAAALAEMVTEDGEFWAHEAPPLQGREALIARMTEFYEAYEIDQGFEREEIVISGDLAFVRGTEVNRVTVRDDEGAPPMEIRQRAFSILFRGADGAWRFARGMTHKPPEEQPG